VILLCGAAGLVACSGDSDADDHDPGNAQVDIATDLVRPFEEPEPLSWRALGEPGIGARTAAVSIDPYRRDRVLVGIDVGGVGYSGDDGRSWQRSAGLTSQEIGRFTFDPERPGVVWVGTMGGPHRSDDGGETWELRRDGMPDISPDFYTSPIEIVLSDPSRRGHLLAFGGSHTGRSSLGEPRWGTVWESFDDGLEWSERSTIGAGANIVAAARTADGTVLAAALDKGLFRSHDNGGTWTPATTGLPHSNIRDIAVHPTDPNRVWVALGAGDPTGIAFAGGVYRTDDGGDTWVANQAGLETYLDAAGSATSNYETIAVAPGDPEVLYTADSAPGQETIYKTVDAGRTWQRVLDGPMALNLAFPYDSGPTALSMVVDPEDADRVVAGQGEYLLRTADGGETWQQISSTRTAAGSWTGKGLSGLVATDISFGPDGTTSLMALDGAGLLRSGDRLRSWSRPLVPWDPWGGAYEMSQVEGDESQAWLLLGQAGVFNGIAYSADGGLNWEVQVDGGLPARGAFAAGGYAVEVQPDGTVFAIIGGELYRSSGPDSSWTLIQSGLALTDIERSETDSGLLVLGGEAGLFTSRDRGDTMDLVEGTRVRPSRVVLDQDRGDIYVLGWREPTGGLWRYRNEEWTRLFDEVHAYDLAIDPSAPEHLLLTTNDHPFHDVSAASGVWRSTDEGSSWTQMNQGLLMPRVSTIAFDPNTPGRVVAGTFGGGFYHTTGVVAP